MSQGAPGSEPTRSVHATEPSGRLSGDATDSSNSSSEDVEVAHDGTLECDCLRKASQEIHELQMKYPDLLVYFQYLEENSVPHEEREARRIVLQCEKVEIIEGVLHHQDTADPARWCIIVPKQLRQIVLTESSLCNFQWTPIRKEGLW